MSIPLANAEELGTEGSPLFSRCHMYAVNFTEVMMSGIKTPDSTWPIKKCDNGWSFNYTGVPYASIAAEVYFYLNKNFKSYIHFNWL